jgi:hypothetical protein|eukprot:CAMPEP_0177767738 /NCGR_PEP_ID=MMETSP0491_2-20121128/9305_1 /TAXON_ID=63592 /ORGANISM="Tetraselmis chuii, Strain PLY429" /LENGTH=70 /DNA_ID=CAMNT_0019284413 /DNA_START=391 /DNA_END=603 /DNA_ORIENTATION=-
MQLAAPPVHEPKKRKRSAVDVRAGVLRISNEEHIRTTSLLVEGAPPRQQPRERLLNIIQAKLPQVVPSLS